MKFAGKEFGELDRAIFRMKSYEPFEPQVTATDEERAAVHEALKPFYDQKRREVYEAAVAFVKACEAED